MTVPNASTNRRGAIGVGHDRSYRVLRERFAVAVRAFGQLEPLVVCLIEMSRVHCPSHDCQQPGQ